MLPSGIMVQPLNVYWWFLKGCTCNEAKREASLTLSQMLLCRFGKFAALLLNFVFNWSLGGWECGQPLWPSKQFTAKRWLLFFYPEHSYTNFSFQLQRFATFSHSQRLSLLFGYTVLLQCYQLVSKYILFWPIKDLENASSLVIHTPAIHSRL